MNHNLNQTAQYYIRIKSRTIQVMINNFVTTQSNYDFTILQNVHKQKIAE